MANHYLSIEGIGKSYTRAGATTEVLRDVTLGVEKGEYISIIGHSGCGKSTLLNIVAGLTPSSVGAVLLDGKTLETVSEFCTFIKPVRHPVLTPFCTKLTTITQADVDVAPMFPEALANLKAWLELRRDAFLHADDDRPRGVW